MADRNRNYAWLLGLIGALWCASDALAMYTPNPAGRWPGQRFFLAGDFQYVDKDLDDGGELEDAFGFFVRPGFSVAPNVVLYGRFGGQTADNVDAGIAAGLGIQGAYVIPQAPEFAVGGAFDFLYWDGEVNRADESIDWKEFQISPAVSYNIPRVPQLTPYGGVLIDFVDGSHSISQDDPVGLLFGTNFDPTPHLRLDAQFRVVSEFGFFFSVGYIF